MSKESPTVNDLSPVIPSVYPTEYKAPNVNGEIKFDNTITNNKVETNTLMLEAGKIVDKIDHNATILAEVLEEASCNAYGSSGGGFVAPFGDTVQAFWWDESRYSHSIDTNIGTFEARLTGVQKDFEELPSGDVLFTNSDGSTVTIDVLAINVLIDRITQLELRLSKIEGGSDE